MPAPATPLAPDETPLATGKVHPLPTDVPSPTATVGALATDVPLATATMRPLATDVPSPTPVPAGDGHALIRGTVHVYQKWNNCGPSAVVMALSAFGIQRDQLAAAAELKPIREDTNVTPEELVDYAMRQGVAAHAAYGGTVEQLRVLVRMGMPVIAEQWIDVTGRGEMGHYRVVVGFDDPTSELVVQDSYYGPLRRDGYRAFEDMWRPFSGAYVVVYPPELEAAVRSAMGWSWEPQEAWRRVAEARRRELEANPSDAWSWFSLGEALSRLGDHAAAVEAFERAIAIGLPFRAFWYQFGYYRSLIAIGAYEQAIAHADVTLASLKGQNLEESHYWRGVALARLDRWPEAAASFMAALTYHPGFEPARQALAGQLP